MNRPDISRLRKNRSIFLKIGFIISLSIVIMAFNITVYEYENKDYITEIPIEVPFEKIIRTPAEKEKKLPPPDLEASDKIIDEDPDYIEDPLPEPIDTEIKVDTQILKYSLPKFTPERSAPPVNLEPKEIIEKVPPIFEVVEDMPRFPGCEDVEMTKKEKKTCSDKALLEYIYSEIKYPDMASKNGIEGTVVLVFIVDTTGEISNIEILKEIGGGCGKEVIRVVSGMPDWIPGKQRGREVRVRFKLPVKFTLQ